LLPVRHYDWIADFGHRTPDTPALIDLASERRLSCAQFDARVSRLACPQRRQQDPQACPAPAIRFAQSDRYQPSRRLVTSLSSSQETIVKISIKKRHSS
jgi:hypothetical protein